MTRQICAIDSRCQGAHEEEEGFYNLLHDKNGHVVVPETLLVQQLNHRVHSSLPYSSSILSDLQELRRTATRVSA